MRQTKKTKNLNVKLDQLEKLKKQKKKCKKLAMAMSFSPTQYVKKYGVPLLDILCSIIEAAKRARDYVGENLLKFLLDLFTTLYNVYKNPEWSGVLLNLSSFFVRNFSSEHADLALRWFKDAFEVVFAQADSNFSPVEYVLSFFKMTDKFLNDQLWDNISDFFSRIMALYAAGTDLISIETLDFKTISEKFAEFRKQIPNVTDIVELAFEAYKFVTGNWKNICTGNWSTLLLGRDETKVFELEIRELEQAYSLVCAGQEIELKNIYNTTVEDYESRLRKAVDRAKKLIVRATSVQQRMSISNFIRKLTEMQSSLWARKADAPVKEEAFAIKMSGPSSCGKSTMIKLMSKAVLNAYNRDPNERGNIVFTNIEERYESTILPSHKIIVADDIANNLNSKPNYDRLLNYINTVPRPLEKAEAGDKGKYYPGNDALIGTTNDDTLRAIECSVCPESILRRFGLDIEVSIRPQFRNEYGGLKKQETLRFDVYHIELKRFSHVDYSDRKNPRVVWDYLPRKEWNPHDDFEHDFHAMCSFVAKDIEIHRRRQQAQTRIQEKLETCGFCEVCKAPDVVCACLPIQKPTEENPEVPTMDNLQSVEQGASAPHDIIPKQKPPDEKPEAIAMAGFQSVWQGMSTRELWDFRAGLSNAFFMVKNWTRMSQLSYRLYNDRASYLRGLALIIIGALCSTLIGVRAVQTITVSTLMVLAYRYHQTLKEIDEELDRRQDRLSSLCEDISTHLERNAKTYFAVSGGVFFAYGLYRAIKPLLGLSDSQDKSTYLDQLTDHFARIIDYPAKGENVYEMQDQRDYKEGYSRLPPKDSAISKTTTSSDLQKSLARALRVVVVKSKGQFFGTVNGIMVASNVIMVPAHVIPYVFPFDIETTPAPGVPSAKTKDQKLTAEYCYIDREVDQAFIHLASSPASTDYSHFFPEEYPTFYNRSTVLMWKSPENEVKISKQAARPNAVDVNYAGYLEHPGLFWGQQHKLTMLKVQKGKGLQYNSEFKGFGGLCGGLLVDAYKGIIYGYHVAGIPNSTLGWSTCVLRSHIDRAMESLRETSPTLVPHSANEVVINSYGTPYSIVNDKPLYLREDGRQHESTVSYFGKVYKDGQPMESRARTPYMKTPYKGIQENFGERKHRPPQNPNDVAKGMKTLNKLTKPVQHYEGDILKKAIDDYEQQMLGAIRNDPEAKNILRVYTQEEAMDGIGEFGLGGLPNDTSAGHPISKSKKHCLKRDPMDESKVKVPREFNDSYDIQEQVDYILDCWKQRLRSESIYKASSKVNELLPEEKAKTKVRKFYGSSFANFVASRRMLAGVARIMKRHWKKSECTVGINPLSKEWDEFVQHLIRYGPNSMIAGDFAGFDTTMAAQITGAASRIILRWYAEAGCTTEELTQIAGALSDIIHPNIIFDGDLYRFANGNPSGNLITVQLNSICNSIMMRYVYYAQMPNIREPFETNVTLGTYGDDNAMSVHPRCKWFTHTSCQEEFAKLDISYTMADKDAESVPYIKQSEVSFLKRSFVYHEDLGKIVAPIEEDSILKKFHWIKKPTESPLSFAEQFGAYTDGAMREYCLHGKEKYEDFIEKLKDIVSRNDDLRGVINFVPYSEMIEILKPDYSDDYVNKNEKLFTESFGVSLEDMEFIE